MTEVRTEFVHTGESASLYNCSLSPGFTEAEVQVLRLALIKFGIGKWAEIVNSGCLPGKTPAQLNLQTQRLLGQQSTAEFMGLHVDPDKIRIENNKKQGPDVKRKNGCIVNSGNKMKREEIRDKMRLNLELYGVSEEIWRKIELPTANLPMSLNGSTKGKPALLVASTGIETDSEPPFTSESDTDYEDGGNVDVSATTDVSTAVLRLKIQEDLAQLRTLAEKRRELRRILGKLQEANETTCSNGARIESIAGRQKKRVGNGKSKGQKLSKKKNAKTEEGEESDDFQPARARQASKQSEYNEDEEDSSCLCFRGYEEGDFMLDCDQCHRWYHGECVGVPSTIPEDFNWLCSQCCP